MGMAAILINRPWPFEQIFNPPLTEGPTWHLKKIGLVVSEEKYFKGVDGRKDDGQTDDGWQVIKLAHSEPSAQVS